MLSRILLAGIAIAALGAPAANAGPKHLLFPFCGNFFFAKSAQCAVQLAKGHHNRADTVQFMDEVGHQLALTFQDGNDNRAYTEQNGTKQFAVTVQKGDGNSAYTYQQGEKQIASTVQIGSGNWAGTSSIGDNTATSVYQSN